MIPVDSFYQKLNSVRAVVVKRKPILIVVFLQINSSYSHLLQMDFSLLACQHFGCIGCLKIWIWPLSIFAHHYQLPVWMPGGDCPPMIKWHWHATRVRKLLLSINLSHPCPPMIKKATSVRNVVISSHPSATKHQASQQISWD